MDQPTTETREQLAKRLVSDAANNVALDDAPAKDSPPLYGYPKESVGGQSIQRGRDAYDNGEPCPKGWPYLATRGWYDRKAECAIIVEDYHFNGGPDLLKGSRLLDSPPTTGKCP